MSSLGVAQASARGALILFAGNLVSTALVTVDIILIARLLGPEGYGAYSLALLVPSIIQLFVGFGVGSAVTRYVPYSLSKGEAAKAASMTRTAIIFTLTLGLLLSALNFLLAPLILVNLIHRPELIQYQAASSLLIVGSSVSQLATSALVGWGSMVQASGVTILQSASKLVLQVGLILAGFGVYGAVTGHVASFIIAGCAGTILLFVYRFRRLTAGNFLHDLKTMLRFGLPIFTGSVAQGLSAQYATLVLAAYAANAVVGYYQAAINVTVPLNVISASVQNVFFRSFAELHGLDEDISLAFSYAVRYVSLISTPISFFLTASAAELFDLFYGQAYAPGIFLLRLVAISYLPVAVGFTVLPAFFGGVGKSRFVMIIWLVYAFVLVTAATIFVAGLGLSGEGVMIALMSANVALAVTGLYLSVRYLGVELLSKPLAGIFIAGAIACLGAFLLPSAGQSDVELLLLQSVVYVILYLTLVPLFRGLDADDIVRLQIAVGTLGPLRRVFLAILAYEHRILRIGRKQV